MNELIAINQASAIELFSGKCDGLQTVIDRIKNEAQTMVADVTTTEGRATIRTMAANIAKAKTKLDGLGKDSVADKKAEIKITDNARKAMRNELDELKTTTRQPLTDWETAEAELKEAERIAAEIEAAYEQALIENDLFDRQRELEEREAKIAAEEAERKAEAEAEQAAKEQVDRDERIKQEAAEKAKKDAEEAAENARLKAEKAAADAVAETERLKREKIEAEAALEKGRIDGIRRLIGEIKSIGNDDSNDLHPRDLARLAYDNERLSVIAEDYQFDEFQGEADKAMVEAANALSRLIMSEKSRLKAEIEQQEKDAAAKAEADKQAAIEEEQRKAKAEADRVEQERVAKKKADKAKTDKLAANKAHRKAVDTKLVAVFVKHGYDEEDFIELIALINSDVSPYIAIRY